MIKTGDVVRCVCAFPGYLTVGNYYTVTSGSDLGATKVIVVVGDAGRPGGFEDFYFERVNDTPQDAPAPLASPLPTAQNIEEEIIHIRILRDLAERYNYELVKR